MKQSHRFNYFYPSINGVDQFVAIDKEARPSKPTIIFLHGGPGMVASSILDEFLLGFEEFCNLVVWDQRGAGLSFSDSIDPKTMTLHNLVQDTAELTTWVQEKFGSERIFLMGHSWGSTLGIYAAARFPEMYRGFISVGQWLIDDDSAIKERVETVKSMAQSDGNIDKNLERIIDSIQENFYWTDDILIENGYALESKTNTWDFQMRLIQNSLLYEQQDKDNYSKGMTFSEHLYNDVINQYRVMRDIEKLPIPSLFLIGENDLVTPKKPIANLVHKLKQNGSMVEMKELTNSRHYSFMDSPELFLRSVKDFIDAL